MLRTKNESEARLTASEQKKCYGMSVFDGWYYTGTISELEAIGCINIVRFD